MIAIIQGTNRPESTTSVVAQYIYKALKDSGEVVELVDLSEMPFDIISDVMYQEDGQHPVLSKLQDEVLIPAERWWVVSPEYNGSYAGILKLFVDAISVRKYKETFQTGKKMALTGVATGRGGNLRGLDHLTTSFNYLGFQILPNRLPLSNIAAHIDKDGILSEEYKLALASQQKQFLAL